MAPSDSWLDTLPADFYAQLTHTLNLHGMAALELLSRPATPATTRLHQLTGLDVTTVHRLNCIASHAQLLAALRQEPLAVYHLLLLGGLTLETSLAAPVLAYVRQAMGITEEQLGQLLAYCQQLSEAFLGQLEEHVAAPAGTASLGLHRLAVEEAFAAFLAGQLAARPVAELRPLPPQLHIMRLALLLAVSLPQDTDHPFAQAVSRLPHLQPPALEPLIARLGHAQAHAPLPLSMPEVVQLYQALQVCGMVFVSDLMSQIGLEDAFPTLSEEERRASEPAPASNREAVGSIVGGFTQWVQQHFPDHPEIALARQQVLALADLL
ncbi:hypothetical protein J7E24_06480 [Hymenobacter sp. ISL-91]|uniref:hypothetical protein n=1 Tax=Hymenobacter sp. ISL-91 TaxID=2819151 RepID=UPI001BE701FE|nr:hypothetical protein [Hymenobacter sp. ISL-91]MBT2557425.1 hypothetical protein [Hymenobacter sp. ISL-91]